MKKYLIKKEEGIALYVTIIILGIIFSIGFTMATLLMGEFKIARNISNFVPAIYAADTGIERALYKVRKSGDFAPGACGTPPCSYTLPAGPGTTLNNGAVYSVEVLDTGAGSCTAAYQCIKAVGSVEETNRAFGVTF